jgi:hypothetical protein
MVELQETQDIAVDKVDGALKAKIKRLQKERRGKERESQRAWSTNFSTLRERW